MRKTDTKFNFIIAFILFFPIWSIKADSPILKDAGLWQNLYIEKKIFSKTTAHLNEQSRFDRNITHFNYIYLDGGITYKPFRWLHLSLDYVPIFKNLETYISVRHQYYVDAVLVYKWRQFAFYNRCMWQEQFTDVNSSETGRVPYWLYRDKITVKYEWYNYTPYFAYESYYRFLNPSGNNFVRN